MTALRKKSSPRADLAQQRLAHARDRRRRGSAPAREPAPAGRTRACSLSSAARNCGTIARIGVVLEEAVGDGAQPIVGAGQRLAHRVLRARIVEAGQQDERAVADVAVGLLRDGLQQRRHRLRGRRAADGARRVRARRVVEIAELVDRGLQLRRRDRLRRRRFLRRAAARAEHTRTPRTQRTQTRQLCAACLRVMRRSLRHRLGPRYRASARAAGRSPRRAGTATG